MRAKRTLANTVLQGNIERRSSRGRAAIMHLGDDAILQEFDIKRELHGHVRKRKLSYFGHLCRDHGCQITKTVVEGYVDGRRIRGRPRKQYMDNIKQWTKMTTLQCVRTAEDRSRWKQLVSQAMVADDHT